MKKILFCAAAILVLLLGVRLSLYAAEGVPSAVAISNLRDTCFSVSWQTAEKEVGHVELLDGTVYPDVRGVDVATKLHYISVDGLKPETPYAFDIVSGARKYDNGGTHWQVRTGTTLPPRDPDIVNARVLYPDGSLATNVLVFVMIERQQQGSLSALMTGLITRDDGIFRINLSDSRPVGNPDDYFEYTIASDRFFNNSVNLLAWGEQGSAVTSVEMNEKGLRTTDPEQMIQLHLTSPTSQPTAASGTGTAAASQTPQPSVTVLPAATATLTSTSTLSPTVTVADKTTVPHACGGVLLAE